MKIRALIVASLAGASPLAGATTAHAQSADPIVGEVRTFAADWCPRDFLPADGRLLPVGGVYVKLFSLFANKFGGDGRRTFALPMLKPEVDVNETTLIRCIAYDGQYPARP